MGDVPCRLRNSYIDLTINTRSSDQIVYISSLQLIQDPVSPSSSTFTPNLLHSPDSLDLLSSSSSLLSGQTQWILPTNTSNSILNCQATQMDYTNLITYQKEAQIISENWTISINNTQLSWTVTRTYLSAVDIIADRFPALVWCTSPNGYSGCQIPGFFDLTMQLNGTTGFIIPTSNTIYEVLSNQLQQNIHLMPSKLNLKSTMSMGQFSYAKPESDGTASLVVIGSETVARQALAHRDVGDVLKQVWTLELSPAQGLAPFSFQLASPSNITDLTSQFAILHNAWMGFIYGNNPASVPCLHEMSWWPQSFGIYKSQNNLAFAGMESELRFFAATAISSNGYVMPRWSIGGYYTVVWGPLHDQIPHFILSIYYHVINTGNKAFLTDMMPALDLVSSYMQSIMGSDGVLRVPGASGLPDGGRHASNWYDVINFGNADAIINSYVVKALQAMSEMKQYTGNNDEANKYKTLYETSLKGFNQMFWNDTCGYYMDWVDVNGNGRSYFYTEQNLLAIIHGIANNTQATSILNALDQSYKKLYSDYNINSTSLYSTPANMLNVSLAGDQVISQYPFPNYENGGSFFHLTGFEIAARFLVGQTDNAQKLYENILFNGFQKNGLWGAGLDWSKGQLFSEPLNNALLIVWCYLRGGYGIWPTLNGGIIVAGTPAPALEGSLHQFSYLGSDYQATVVNGVTKVTKVV